MAAFVEDAGWIKNSRIYFQVGQEIAQVFFLGFFCCLQLPQRCSGMKIFHSLQPTTKFPTKFPTKKCENSIKRWQMIERVQILMSTTTITSLPSYQPRQRKYARGW